MKWRPISTAPKGKYVLLLKGDMTYFGELLGGKKPHLGIWGFDESEYKDGLHSPTHWAPLPEPLK